MEITYMVIVALVTYVFGALNKAFIKSMPNKYIPLQNVVIGLISAFICYFTKVETNLLVAISLCMISSAGAGGIEDLRKLTIKESE